jgi:hypothetical protein
MINIEEDKFYPFLILGIVEGVDGEEFFKLADPNGVKHLLNTQWYKDYNLKKGETVICHIDKINCNGRIFIEPEHPFYKLDNIYNFTISGFTKQNEGESAIVQDALGNEILIPKEDLSDEISVGEVVKYKVISIKKGKPFIIPANLPEADYKGFIPEGKYDFKVIRIKRYSDKYQFFVIKDEKGREFLLRKKFYEKYGISIGNSISCTFKNIKTGYNLEPEHPYYKIGRIYEFDILEETVIYKYPELKEDALLLKNNFGKDIPISKKLVSKSDILSGKISCFVKDIVKGQLVLDCS